MGTVNYLLLKKIIDYIKRYRKKDSIPMGIGSHKEF